jgi:hypothetical protein
MGFPLWHRARVTEGSGMRAQSHEPMAPRDITRLSHIATGRLRAAVNHLTKLQRPLEVGLQPGLLSRRRWELSCRLVLARQARQFNPGPDTELGEDVAQVGIHRVGGDVKLLGYLTVGRALDD